MKLNHSFAVLALLAVPTMVGCAAVPAEDDAASESAAELNRPNGRIAYFRLDADIDDYRLYTANPDGTKVRLVTNDIVTANFAHWSPDGKRIVYDFIDDTGNQQLASIKADGTDRKVLTNSGVF